MQYGDKDYFALLDRRIAVIEAMVERLLLEVIPKRQVEKVKQEASR